jgi:transposase
MHCFQAVQLDNPLVVRIRELSRMETSLRLDWSRLTNQLREQIHRYYPQLLKLCPAADESWIWALLELAPFPAKGSSLKKSCIEELLRKCRIRRISAEEIVAVLGTPPLPVAPGTAEAASEVSLQLIARLRLLNEQRALVARRINEMLHELVSTAKSASDQRTSRDVELLCSLPGWEELWFQQCWLRPLSHLPLGTAMRSYAGIAPVTRQSGKRKQVVMRYGCNQQLRDAVYHWSRVSLQKDERTREHYARLRQRGHGHGRALRGVADRLLAVLISMLKNQSPYDPARRSERFCT